jgi:hypothetical protein
MSRTEKPPNPQNTRTLNNKIATAVAQILRQNYSEINSAIKVIGLKTGAPPRTIRNWYDGRNAPSSAHIVMLARHIPAIAEAILTLSGQQNIWTAYKMVMEHSYVVNALPPEEVIKKYLSSKTVSINVTLSVRTISKLNQRQLWFLGKLQQGMNAKPDDIIAPWKVNSRTCWRDIAMLEKMGLIQFVGAKKTGHYELTNDFFML